MTAHVAGLIAHDCLWSDLSPADYKVLRLLQKGCAYQVRGAWRFRGLRTCVKERALVSVLEKGLAERVETEQHHQVKITLAGSAANQKGLRVEVEPFRGIGARWTLRSGANPALVRPGRARQAGRPRTIAAEDINAKH